MGHQPCPPSVNPGSLTAAGHQVQDVACLDSRPGIAGRDDYLDDQGTTIAPTSGSRRPAARRLPGAARDRASAIRGGLRPLAGARAARLAVQLERVDHTPCFAVRTSGAWRVQGARRAPRSRLLVLDRGLDLRRDVRWDRGDAMRRLGMLGAFGHDFRHVLTFHDEVAAGHHITTFQDLGHVEPPIRAYRASWDSARVARRHHPTRGAEAPEAFGRWPGAP